MVAHTMLRRFAVGAAMGILAAGTFAGTAQASTTQAENDLYQGQVIDRDGLNVRSGPSTSHRILPPPVPYGTVIRIECKVDGQNVDGNRLWYRLDDARFARGYVTARFVDNIGRAPHYCPDQVDLEPSASESTQQLPEQSSTTAQEQLPEQSSTTARLTAPEQLETQPLESQRQESQPLESQSLESQRQGSQSLETQPPAPQRQEVQTPAVQSPAVLMEIERLS